MRDILRVLHLEDSPKDAELIQLKFEASDVEAEIVHVACRDSFLTELAKGGFDVILADYSLPSFDGISALELTKNAESEVPFLFVSGSIGEELAIESLKLGATDYVTKNNLGRLIPAVKRALFEEDERKKRKEAETKLQHAYREMENVVSSISLILIGVDPMDRITIWNEAAEHAFGFTSNEVIGKQFLQVNISWSWNAALEFIAISQEATKRTKWNDIQYTRQDGGDGLLNITVSPISNSQTDTAGFLLLAEDITERRNLEMQLMQAQKLESVGQLAAGIAHEINTPIQFISDNLHFLKDACAELLGELPAMAASGAIEQGAALPDFDEEATGQIAYLAEEIPEAVIASLDGVSRVSQIVDAMRYFSHPGFDQKTPVDINKALEKTTIVANSKWKYVADVVTDFDPDLPLLPCLPGELNQVFLNIIVNAADAISDNLDQQPNQKGKITITTQHVGDKVRIRFRDTGTGIPEAIQQKIFNPFFTTKEIGKGTGQGLAISHNVVVQKHGGSINIESEMGKGTLFIIDIPLSSEEASN